MPAASPRARLTLARAALAYAHDYVGIEEIGANTGPAVRLFLRAANINEPAAWCAAFINLCAELGGAILNVVSPLEKVPRQAFVQDYWTYGVLQGWEVKFEQARAGDLFLLWHRRLERYAHIGFVDCVDLEARSFTTVEGNTNDDGGREGYKVSIRTRNASAGTVFLRFSEGDHPDLSI